MACPTPGRPLPVVAVPTTAGTGSEATRNAVITERGPDGYKRSFRDERLVPADAVVDPDLLASRATVAHRRQRSRRADPAARGLHVAAGHARSRMVWPARGLAAARDGLLTWHDDPTGPSAPAARSRMAYAALLSGICLANAGPRRGPRPGQPAGRARCPIPHGVACGAVLWQTVRANIAALEARAPGSPALAATRRAGPGTLRWSASW